MVSTLLIIRIVADFTFYNAMVGDLLFHIVISRHSHVVKRALSPCVACLLVFAAVFVCFFRGSADFRGISAHSAGAQTQFIHARCAREVPRYCTAMSASTRGVKNCAPSPQMSAKALRVRKNSPLASAYSASTKASLNIQNKNNIPHSTATSKDVANLNARARILNARALNMVCNCVLRGR